MLSAAENEVITQIGPGTPAGEMMREYWLPLVESSDLPGPDTGPMRVRLLGEDLVTFRDSNGRVGLLAERCAHRGASLFFGRNEECGLRCVYHGWKYDVDGRCVDMPNEPGDSTFKERIRQIAYPCEERNGVVWAYLGPRDEPPPLPDLEAMRVPEDQRYVMRTLRECNWLQALEGDVDSSHISFLHAVFNPEHFAYQDFEFRHRDKAPVFHVERTDYGAVYGARRTIDGQHHWRIAQFLMPFYTIIPPNDPSRIHLSAWVPIDDHNTQFWGVVWNPAEPMHEDELQHKGRRQPIPGFELDRYLADGRLPVERGRLVGNSANDYLIDYEAQRTTRFSGIPTFHLQDKAMTESMGPVADRSSEHLGKSDMMIIKTRRRILNTIKAHQSDKAVPPGVDEPTIYGVRSASLLLDKETDWLDGAAEYLKAFTDTPVAFVT
jgi:phthalate 4,5-dioxygenase oxygenase subunit